MGKTGILDPPLRQRAQGAVGRDGGDLQKPVTQAWNQVQEEKAKQRCRYRAPTRTTAKHKVEGLFLTREML